MLRFLTLLPSLMAFSSMAQAKTTGCSKPADKAFFICDTTRTLCPTECSDPVEASKDKCSQCQTATVVLAGIWTDDPAPISLPDPDALVIIRLPFGLFNQMVAVLGQPQGTTDLQFSAVSNFTFDADSHTSIHTDTPVLDATVLRNAILAWPASTTLLPTPALPTPALPITIRTVPPSATGAGGH
ncbi:MAG: hypothetical protein GXP62_13520 [Oligoflexia bacterium]|nr:hypothetical protein [Oligoflexia bacterium]